MIIQLAVNLKEKDVIVVLQIYLHVGEVIYHMLIKTLVQVQMNGVVMDQSALTLIISVVEEEHVRWKVIMVVIVMQTHHSQKMHSPGNGSVSSLAQGAQLAEKSCAVVPGKCSTRETPARISISSSDMSEWRCNPWEGIGGHRAPGARQKEQKKNDSWRWGSSATRGTLSRLAKQELFEVSNMAKLHSCR